MGKYLEYDMFYHFVQRDITSVGRGASGIKLYGFCNFIGCHNVANTLVSPDEGY
jgi:hypothetical protein